MNVFNNSFAFFLLSLLCFSYSSNLRANEEVITEIILINGFAELVDINPNGDVLQRYLSIPDYFSSGRSHKRTLRESLAKAKLFGNSSEEESYIETMGYKAPRECRQALMKRADKEDLVLYVNSFGNEVGYSSLNKETKNQFEDTSHGKFSISGHDKNRIAIRRQRTIVYSRFKAVELRFRSTNRTSKATIGV
jgi:hypothetical protein